MNDIKFDTSFNLYLYSDIDKYYLRSRFKRFEPCFGHFMFESIQIRKYFFMKDSFYISKSKVTSVVDFFREFEFESLSCTNMIDRVSAVIKIIIKISSVTQSLLIMTYVLVYYIIYLIKETKIL